MVEHLDIASPGKLQTFQDNVIAPLNDRDDVVSITCMPLLYLDYISASSAPSNWSTWVETDAFAKKVVGSAYYGEQTGQYSGSPVPRTIVCSISAFTFTGDNSNPRIDVMDWFLNFTTTVNTKYADTCFPCDATRVYFYAKDWAMKTSLDKELPTLCWNTIAYALITVGVVLLLVLPVHRAIISVLNIFLVVFAIIGFMGITGVNYNLISYCTLTMAIGFCVDYTVELMHFSVIGEPGDSMGHKFANALRACGYDVLHGCMTALIGVFILGFSGAMYARIFRDLSLVMCAYGGMYALWSLPSSMTIITMIPGTLKIFYSKPGK